MPDDEISIDDSFADDELVSVPDTVYPEFRWTIKRQEFVYHMARHGIARQAARESGLTEKTSEVLMKHQAIRDAIQVEVARGLAVVSESENSVIARWAEWANGNIADFLNNDWTVRPLDEIPAEKRRCIRKVKITRNAHGVSTEIELHDQAKANTDLANMMGLLHKGETDTLPPEETAKQLQETLQEIRKRNGNPVPVETPAGNSERGPDKRLN